MFLQFMGLWYSDTTQTFYLELTGEVVRRLLAAMNETDNPTQRNADVDFHADVIQGAFSFFRSEPAPREPNRGPGVIRDLPVSAVPAADMRLVIRRTFDFIDRLEIEPSSGESGAVGLAGICVICSAMLLAADQADLDAVLKRYSKEVLLDCLDTLERGVSVRGENGTGTMVPVLDRLTPADLTCLLHAHDRGDRARARLLIGRTASRGMSERPSPGRRP